MSDLVNNILNDTKSNEKDLQLINNDIYYILDLIYKNNLSTKNIINKQKITSILINNYEYYDPESTDVFGGDYIKYIPKEVEDIEDIKMKNGGFLIASTIDSFTLKNGKRIWKINFNTNIIFRKLNNDERFRMMISNYKF